MRNAHVIRGNERKPSTSRRMTFMILGVGGFLALLIGWNMLGKYFAGQAVPEHDHSAADGDFDSGGQRTLAG
jgi:hypothetical protein